MKNTIHLDRRNVSLLETKNKAKENLTLFSPRDTFPYKSRFRCIFDRATS